MCGGKSWDAWSMMNLSDEEEEALHCARWKNNVDDIIKNLLYRGPLNCGIGRRHFRNLIHMLSQCKYLSFVQSGSLSLFSTKLIS